MLIIFEGLDNTGKDTQISLLKDSMHNDITIHEHHWQAPTKEYTDDDKIYEYETCMSIHFNHYASKEENIHIWNRSHLGEYVYGQLYRNTRPQDWLFQKEEHLLHFCNKEEIFLFQFDGNTQHLINNDDGKSYTIDINNKEKEQLLFIDAFNQSKIINKKLINISNENDTFIDKYTLSKSILNFIKQRNENYGNYFMKEFSFSI